MSSEYMQYFTDPVYDEDYGVSRSKAGLYIAGAAVGGALLFLRSPAGHRALSRVARAPRRATLLERRMVGLYHDRRELSSLLHWKFKDDPEKMESLLKAHSRRLREEFVERSKQMRSHMAERFMGLEPVTVGDLLGGKVPELKLSPFRLMRGPLGPGEIGLLEDADPEIMRGWLRGLVRDFTDFKDAPIDPGLFRSASGELVDLRGIQSQFDSFVERLSDISVPIVNWNIGQIARLPLRREVQRRPSFSFFKKGSEQPFFGGALPEDTVLIGRKLVSLGDPEKVIAEGVYLSPFGTPVRAAAQIAQAGPTRGYASSAHEFFDIGAQSEDSWFSHIGSIFTKDHDPTSVRGAMNLMLEGRSYQDPARTIVSAIRYEAMPLPKDLMEGPQVRKAISEAYWGIFQDGRVPLDTQEDLISTLYTLISHDRLSARYGKELRDNWRWMSRSPESYFRRMTFTREHLPQLPYGGPSQVKRISQEERLRHLLQTEIREFVHEKTGSSALAATPSSHIALQRMSVAEMLSRARNAEELRQLMMETTSAGRSFRKMLENVVHSLSPWYAPGYSGPSPSRQLARRSGGGVLVREMVKAPSPGQLFEALHDPDAARQSLQQTKSFLRQFAAGRHDLDNFTTGSLAVYQMMSRLNDMLSFLGLGLSHRHLGSAQQIFANLLGRRYIAAMAIAGYAGYINWEIHNAFGYSPKQAALDAAATMNIGWAKLTDITGITALTKRMDQVLPGSELAWEIPIANILDPRWTADELAEFLYEGEAPVRKGRWWQYGQCVHPDTQIQTGFGETKAAKDIAEGDFVVTHTGQRKKVLATVSRQMKSSEKMYKLVPGRISWGPVYPVLVTDIHPLLILRQEECHYASYDLCRPDRPIKSYPCNICKKGPQKLELEWVQAEDVEIGDWLAYPAPKITEETTEAHGIALTKDIGYFVGLYFADGNPRNWKNEKLYAIDLALKKDDQCLIERVESILEKTWGARLRIDRTRHREENNFQSYYCSSIKVGSLLQSLIYNGREKVIPQEFLSYPKEFVKGFLEGLFDGDGYVMDLSGAGSDVHPSSIAIGLRSTRAQQMLQVWNLLLALGIVASISHAAEETPFGVSQAYRLTITGVDSDVALRVLDLHKAKGIDPDLLKTKSTRKHAILTDEYLLLELIDKIDIGYCDIVYDFEIDGDHSFCSVFNVLHNSPIQGEAIEHFWPSWYRRWSTDWQFTHVGYGDRETAYRNWWLPTPRSPMAPIRHFITDPYHREEMWGRDRPYPITGPIPLFANIPVIGPILSATIGRVLKPGKELFPEDMELWRRGEYEYPPGQHVPSRPVIAETTPTGIVRRREYLDAPVYYDPSDIDPESLPEGAQIVYEEVPYSSKSGILTAFVRLRGINEGKMIRARVVEEEAEEIDPRRVRPDGIPVRSRRIEDLVTPAPAERDLPRGDHLGFQVAESFSQLTILSGLYGFMLRTVTGTADRPWESIPRLATPERELSLGSWFRDLQAGGYPGDLSEIGRRFIPVQRYLDPEVHVNPIINRMPSWMPQDYFRPFHQGDPYSLISGAQYRLPGPGFEMMQDVPDLGERLEELFPDTRDRNLVAQAIAQGQVSPYETYGLWERFKILADTAPYSDEYAYYEKLLTDNKHLIPATKLEQFQRVKKQVSEYKKRERFFPYRFRDTGLEYRDVTIRRVIDANTFIAHGMDDPVRFAGIYVPQGQDEAGDAAYDYLSQFIYPGAKVRIGYAADELRRQGTDQLESIRAVVEAGGRNLNREMLKLGIASEREQEDPASIHVRFSPTERFIGGLWERVTHIDNFFSTKFLQIRSPLEMYERRDLYGQSWQSWSKPFRDILLPTLESFAAKAPYISALYGYGYGRLLTIASHDRAFQNRMGGYVAAGFAALSMLRAGSEMITGEKWIPRRRRVERDFELYFSALEYIRYRGIYEFAARRAWEEEGFDVHEFFGDTRREGRSVGRWRQDLESLKRELIIEGTDLPRWRLRQINEEILRLGGPGSNEIERINEEIQIQGLFEKEAVHAALIRNINAKINYLGDQRSYTELSPWAEVAVMAKEAYESTIYGMDIYGHLEPIMRGLPKKDRTYLTEFLKAPEFERKRILESVPVYTRRVLQARWGMEPDQLPSLEEVFSTHFLPRVGSEIWSPGKSFEDLKIKTAEAVGLELSEVGLWRGDLRRARRHRAPALPWKKPAVVGVDMERQLQAILEGQGLEDVWVRLTPSEKHGVRMSFNIQRDPSEMMRNMMMSNFASLIGGA